MPPEVLKQSQDAMAKMAWFEGTWTGTGWMQLGPDNRETSDVLEEAEMRLDGTLLLLEGLGTSEGKVVHSAVGVISFSPATNSYSMRAYRPGGMFIDAEIEVGDDQIIWGFEDPRAGKIRYTVTHSEDDEWIEHGEISRDGGETWFPFFGMTLTRRM